MLFLCLLKLNNDFFNIIFFSKLFLEFKSCIAVINLVMVFSNSELFILFSKTIILLFNVIIVFSNSLLSFSPPREAGQTIIFLFNS